MREIKFTTKQKKVMIGGVVAIVLAIFGVSNSAVVPSIKKSAKQKKEVSKSPVAISFEKFYPVIRVIDGDTLVISADGQDVTVRLLGINTPEAVDPRKAVQCFGKEASNKAKEILMPHTTSTSTSTLTLAIRVHLETDPTQDVVDRYDRLLAYVTTEDGLFLNKYMIEQGYAYEYTYDKPYRYQKEFKQAQIEAQANHLGLWNDAVCPVKK